MVEDASVLFVIRFISFESVSNSLVRSWGSRRSVLVFCSVAPLAFDRVLVAADRSFLSCTCFILACRDTERDGDGPPLGKGALPN